MKFLLLTSVIIMTFSIQRRKFNYFRQVSHEIIHHEKVADATLGLAGSGFLTSSFLDT